MLERTTDSPSKDAATETRKVGEFATEIGVVAPAAVRGDLVITDGKVVSGTAVSPSLLSDRNVKGHAGGLSEPYHWRPTEHRAGRQRRHCTRW